MTTVVAGLGQVREAGGRRVRARVWPGGDGTPVVFSGGCGLSLEYWYGVIDLLPDRPLLTFDRPGIGGTAWPGHLPTLAEEVSTLADLVEGFGRPAIVVGHSMAAFHVEALARTRPELVAEVLLVDPSVEWPTGPPPAAGLRLPRFVRSVTSRRVGEFVGRSVWRWGAWLQSQRGVSKGSAEQGGDRAHGAMDADALAAATAEAMAYEQQAWDLMEVRQRAPWPEVGGAMLCAGNGWGAEAYREEQARLAHLLSVPHTVVENSKHLMMLDRPDAIADAVRHVGG